MTILKHFISEMFYNVPTPAAISLPALILFLDSFVNPLVASLAGIAGLVFVVLKSLEVYGNLKRSSEDE